MYRYLRIALTVMAMLLFASLAVHAQDEETAAAEAADHPASGNNAAFIADAVDRYFRAFGELPANWSQIRSAGVWDTDLRGPAGQPVDPDDGSLDFPGDAYLRSSGSFFALHMLNPDGSEQQRLLRTGETYQAQFERIRLSRDLVPEHDARLRRYRDDPAKLLQFAHIGLINEAIEDYHGVFGVFPDSVDQLMDSGFCPISPETDNPVTGEPYRFDGSPGDLRLNAAEQFSAVIHVDSDGLISTAIEY